MKFVIQVRTPRGIFLVGDWHEEDADVVLACGMHELDQVLMYDTEEEADRLIKRIAMAVNLPPEAFEDDEETTHPLWVEEIDENAVEIGDDDGET